MQPILLPYARKALLTVVLASAALIALAVLVQVAEALLIFFGALLLGLVLRGLGDWVATRTPLSPRAAVALVLVALVIGTGLAGWALAPGLVAQMTTLRAQTPRLIHGARDWLATVGGGALAAPMNGLAEDFDGIAGPLLNALGGPLRALSYLFIAAISGLYLAIAPGPYFRGLIRLFPPAQRGVAEAAVRAGCLVLQHFLLGRIVSMIAVGVATGVGLALLGVPLAPLLGIIAGIFTFVPYAGPILATLPIALVALSVGPAPLAYALLYYTAVQSVEGFVITPIVQARAVALPPLLTLMAEVVMGLLFGPVGVIVSVPLAALLLFLCRTLYVEGLLEGPRPAENAEDPQRS